MANEKNTTVTRGAIMMIVTSLAFLFLILPNIYVNTRFVVREHTLHKGVSERSVQDVAEYINSRVKKQDYVIAPVEVFWMIRSRALYDILPYIQQYGALNDNFSAVYSVDLSYYSFDAHPSCAKFIVTNKKIALDIGVENYMHQETRDWIKIYENKKYLVHQNNAIDNCLITQ